MNTRRQIESDEPILDDADNVQPRPQPIALDWFKPDTSNRPADRLVPNPTTLVDARFLFAPGNLGVKGIGNSHREPIDGAEVLRRELVTKRRVLTYVLFFAFDRFQKMAVQPHTGFVTARPESNLRQALCCRAPIW